MEVSCEVLLAMLDYILDIRWHEVPYHIAMVAVMICVAYCVTMFLIGFPVSIWEHFTKKKVNAEKEAKIIKAVTVLFSAVMIYSLLYEYIR